MKKKKNIYSQSYKTAEYTSQKIVLEKSSFKIFALIHMLVFKKKSTIRKSSSFTDVELPQQYGRK